MLFDDNIAIGWQLIVFYDDWHRIGLARKALVLSSQELIFCKIPWLFHFCWLLLQKKSEDFLLFPVQLTAIVADTWGLLAKLVSENSGKGISWGFSEVVANLFILFLMMFLMRKERKQ